MKKRVLSLLLAVVMIVGMLPTVALTAFAANETVEYQYSKLDWMKYLPDMMPISEINMPGTHDTGTTKLNFAAQAAGSCQDMTIPEQLMFGMRVLDIRLETLHEIITRYDPKTDVVTEGVKFNMEMDLQVNHGGYDCYTSSGDVMLFEDVLKYIRDFLEKNPSETVVIYASAEGDNKRDAKWILHKFITDFYYSEPNSPYPEGEWVKKFVKCYKPGDAVPTLGEVRGKAVVVLDNGDDPPLPKMRSGTSYEMVYNYKDSNKNPYDDLGESIDKKVEYVSKLFTDAIEKEWTIRYKREDFSRWPNDWPVFREEDYNNQTKIGNPDIKYNGTNITDVSGMITYFTGDGPKKLARKYSELAEKAMLANQMLPGYRFGWITMDFPEMYEEFTNYIIKSNYKGNVFKAKVNVIGIPEVKKEDIKFDIYGYSAMPEITYTYKEGTDLVVGAELNFASQHVNQLSEIADVYEIYVNVQKNGEKYVGSLDSLEVIPTSFQNYEQWCEACGTINMGVCDYVQTSVKVVFDDNPDCFDMRPKTLGELIAMCGDTVWEGYTFDTDSQKVKRAEFVPKVATEDSYQGNSLVSLTQVSDYEYRLTARFPKKWNDSQAFDGFDLTGIINTPSGSIYDATVNDNGNTLVLKLNDVGSKCSYLEYSVEKHSFIQRYCSSYTPINSSMSSNELYCMKVFKSGWYVISGTFTFPINITIDGDVNLILTDGCNLTVNGGIQVGKGSTLTVYAQSDVGKAGSLIADGAAYLYAGIGGNKNEDCGDVIIHGGNVTAYGGNGSAGIGGGYAANGGNVTVYGGNVVAVGGAGGAGIGGGLGIMQKGNGGTLRIFGGSITAYGGKFNSDVARAIGGGVKSTSNGLITVEEGLKLTDNFTGDKIKQTFNLTDWNEILNKAALSFTAYYSEQSEPVSYRYYDFITEEYKDQEEDVYKVLNKDRSEWESGWYVLNESGTIDKVTVSGDVHLILKDECTLTVPKGIQIERNGSLSIYAQSDKKAMGKLIATGSENSAGIGGRNSSIYVNVIIHGGDITAKGHYGGAGIGAGANGNDTNVIIFGGNIDADGGVCYSAGIGGGLKSRNCRVSIFGGNIIAKGASNDGGAGIGGGFEGDGSIVDIFDGDINATGGGKAAGIGRSMTVSSTNGRVTIHGGHISAFGGNYNSGEFDAIYSLTVEVSPQNDEKIWLDGEDGTHIEGSPFTADTDIKNAVRGKKEVYKHIFSSNSYHDNQDGTHSQKCTHCEVYGNKEEHTYVNGVCVCGFKAIEFDTVSLVLSGELGLNFYTVVNDVETVKDGYMLFEIGSSDDTQKVYFKDLTAEDDGRYIFRCNINVLQMADPITVSFHYGDEVVGPRTTSVAQYLKNIVAKNSDNEELAALAHAIENYGHYAQIALQEVHGFTLGEDGKYQTMAGYNDIMLPNAAELAAYKATKTGSIPQITGVSRALALDNGTDILLFFTCADGYTPTATVTDKDGNAVACSLVKDESGRYVLTIPNISAHKLGDFYTVSVDGGAMTINISALSYAYSILNSATSSENLKYAVAALYNYYQAAIAYQAAHE